MAALWECDSDGQCVLRKSRLATVSVKSVQCFLSVRFVGYCKLTIGYSNHASVKVQGVTFFFVATY